MTPPRRAPPPGAAGGPPPGAPSGRGPPWGPPYLYSYPPRQKPQTLCCFKTGSSPSIFLFPLHAGDPWGSGERGGPMGAPSLLEPIKTPNSLTQADEQVLVCGLRESSSLLLQEAPQGAPPPLPSPERDPWGAPQLELGTTCNMYSGPWGP